MQKRLREDGFSLAEMLVVVCIAAVLMSFTMPMISSWVEKSRLLGVARKVTNDLHYCREMAISKNLYYTIVFNSGAIPIVYDIKSGSALGTYDTLVQSVTLSDSSKFTGFVVTGGDPVYDYKGMATSTVVITITNADGKVKTITVNPGGKIDLG